ncbi:uncharacterized mitochondrial protein AtMg00810-like [Lycium barbarum]|uniref:uncharacterized mitochondrial protein AtMg00810-like n=1 Tax=Lycium barbarum TaxID=112863 RepID=UPI00293EDAE2|nr:uncharacterized mitochondrial protein AtMg00810-like [Lycium barbarum]
MSQPPGFIDPKHPKHVCLLKKALYGLKQAPRAWFDRFSLYLLHLGFKCSKADSSLFILQCKRGTILLLLYVDDIIITGSSDELITDILTSLAKEFSMKDLGSLQFFLGTEVQYFKGGIHRSQRKYAAELLKKTDMALAKSVSTPLAQKYGLQLSTGNLVDASSYRSIVGSLQYLTLTRPDLSHAVNLPVKRILIYVKGTSHCGLRLLARSPFKLYGFSDADWGGCTTTRRSTTGYSIYLGANCVSWASKKQHTVSRSSAEAEYRALASITAEITWIAYILRDIGVYLKLAPTLFCDKISALYMTVNPILHARTKHVEMVYHFVREKVARGQLVTHFVRSKDQLADIHTKALTKQEFAKFRSKLGVCVPPPH